MEKRLIWPIEASQTDHDKDFNWNQAGSNICLDFHGNPSTAKLVVFSDGNHHMALEACCQTFLERNPEVDDIFYATTPPGVILQSVIQGGLTLGNLRLNVMPHVFISPINILEKLVKNKFMNEHRAFAKSKGNVLLVKKGNPKNIQNISDLLRDDVTLTLSNPNTELASYEVYTQAILKNATQNNLDTNAFEQLVHKDSNAVVFGESIHHREVPQTIFAEQADVAVVYNHLALRYTRIFPDTFEFIPFDSTVLTHYHIGLMNTPGDWGKQFVEFILSDTAIDIYKQHGLTNI